MFVRRLVALSFLVVSTTAFADSFDINLRDTSAQLQYNAKLGQATLGKSELHLGYLYTSKTNSYVDFGMLVKDDVSANVPGLTVGVGVKGLMAKVPAHTTSAVALGGMLRFAPGPVPRLGLVASAYWSPSILTFGDADRTIETGLRAEYEVIPQASAYLGYRKIRVGLKGLSDATVDEGVHIGVRISF